jgi:hypothetical protein
VSDVPARVFDEAQATDGPLHDRFFEVAADDQALAENAVEQSGECLTYVRNLGNEYPFAP